MINIKTGKKHCILEFLIKKHDAAQDTSRSAIFEREVKAAKEVEDWRIIKTYLSNIEENIKTKDVPMFKNMQAKYGKETEIILKSVRENILRSLKEDGLKILQTQYMVLLLQANYLQFLINENVSLKKITVNDSEINIPEMAKIFCEMAITDKDCEELLEIRKFMIKWREKKL